MLRLRGASSASPIGARVEYVAGGRVVARRQVGSTPGCTGRSWHAVHVGLGRIAGIDAIRIAWPSGATQEVPGPLPVDTALDVTER